jgi:hypothetical protein
MLEFDPEKPLRLPLNGLAAQSEALDALVRLARWSLKVFDRDLCDTGWNSPARIELLAAFLGGSRRARLEIVLLDAGKLSAALPRLMALLRSRGHQIDLRAAPDDARALFDPFAVADGNHYWHRFHYDQYQGELGIIQPDEAGALARRHAELWEISATAATATVLGL